MPYTLAALGLVMHVGGLPTQADFQKPVEVGNTADQSYGIEWRDNDIDPTGLFQFFYRGENVAPDTMPTSLTGTAIPCGVAAQCSMDGTQVIIMDATNLLAWDTSAVPAGSYVLYAITTDPPLPPIYAMSTGVITVQHTGDPLYPAVVVTNPGAVGPPVADAYDVRWEASGEGPFTAHIRYRPKDGDETLLDVATDVPMVPDGPDRWKGCYVWNLSSLANAMYYFVQVEVRDAAGRTHTAYGRTSVTVYRDPNPTDAGVPPSCADLTMPDAGVVDDIDAGPGGGVDDLDGSGCGCRAAGRHHEGVAGGVLVLLMVGWMLARRD